MALLSRQLLLPPLAIAIALPLPATGQNALGVEWVGGGKTGSPAPTRGASNPVGVEWAGSNNGATAPAAASEPNPLGVEWRGEARQTTTPANVPGAQNPLGVEWKGGNNASAPPASGGNNPLGVEWSGNGKPTPAQAPAGNPLGMEWKGSTANAPDAGRGAAQPSPAPVRPSPVTPSPVAPSPTTPSPVAPVPGTPSPKTPLPPTNGVQSGIATLVDDWAYQAVAFSDAGSTVSETRSVSGTLKLKADGQYDQALYIGGILNAVKGSYRVAAGRLETTYIWRGKPVTDVFDLYLDPTGERLTLLGLGSPKTRYTLQRLD